MLKYHAADVEHANGERETLRNVTRTDLHRARFPDGTVIYGWYYTNSDMFDFDDYKVVDGELVAVY